MTANFVRTLRYGGLLLMAAVAGLAHAQENAPQNAIQTISAVTQQDGSITLKIAMKEAMANPPAGFAINNPPRIALDFPDTANGWGKNAQDFNEGQLRSVNLVQSGNRTRLVLNLTKSLSYNAQVDGNSVVVTLQNSAVASVEERSTHFATAKADGQQKHGIRDIDFRRGKNGEGRIIIDLSDSNAGIDLRQQGTAIVVDFLKTDIPRNLERRLDVTDFATPVQKIDTYAQGENARIVVEPTGLWEHAAYQTDNRFILEIKPVTADANKGLLGGKPGYTGEKLSLNFQNVEVRAVLQVIADFTGLNVITSDTVGGNLTLRLKDVPWDQALDVILQSKGLDMRKNGNVIWIAPRDELATKEKLDLESRAQISDLEPTHTESFQLNYQKADAVKGMLSDPKQTLLSRRGSIVVDVRTNTLFIQDTPSRLAEIRDFIKKIDISVRQVMIEARIVEANDKFSRNLGAKLGYTDTSATPGFAPFGGANDPRVSIGGGAAGSNVSLPATGLNNLPAGVFSLMLFNAASTRILNLELTALESDNKGKIISSPRVVTADQIEAIIEQGTEIPYQQSTSSGATSVTFKKATLSLKVKPQITPEDNVIMDLEVHKDAPTGTTGAVDTKQIKTQVLVENGGTVVIGGVYTQDQDNTETKVPLLGDIPVLGYLFKNTAKRDNKTELLIFVTPKILKDVLSAY
ncbi:MAG: type IV pilus secretin PilQ [Pseudomonadota bacterium]